MRILVTGCAGYIGSKVTPYLLDAGHSVIGLDNLAYGNSAALLHVIDRPNFQFVQASIFDYELIWSAADRCDAVIHLAAQVGPLCEKNPDYAWRVNRAAVHDMMVGLSGKRVVYLNTNSGYGSRPDGSYCTETDPLTPISAYGRSKCAGEEAVLKHPNTVVLRLATVFGVSPRMRFDLLVNDFVSKLVYEGHLEVFEPQFRRNFLHIGDACRCVAAAAEWLPEGVFNCGDSEANMTKGQLADLIRTTLHLPPEAVTIGEGKDPDQRDYLVSNEKLKAAGFSCLYGLQEGIVQVARACQILPKGKAAKMRNC